MQHRFERLAPRLKCCRWTIQPAVPSWCVSFGENKIRVACVVRQITSLGLPESKAIVEDLGLVKEDIGRMAAEKIKAKLEEAGATFAIAHIGDRGAKSQKTKINFSHMAG